MEGGREGGEETGGTVRDRVMDSRGDVRGAGRRGMISSFLFRSWCVSGKEGSSV